MDTTLADLAQMLIDEGFHWGAITDEEAQEALDTAGVAGDPVALISEMRLIAGMRR